MKLRKKLALLLAALMLLGLMGCRNQAPSGNSGTEGKLAVTFLSDDGTILKIDYVDKGASAVPPAEPKMSYGMIFQSWDADFSRVTRDLEIRPICQTVKDKTNALAIGGAYGKTGETVTVPAVLCGEVCTAGFDASITYDPQALELIGVTADGGVMYNDEVPGLIRLNYVSMENTEADVDICRLQFRIKAESGTVPVGMELHSIYACSSGVDSEDDSMYVPESCLISGNVYVIP